MNFLSHNDSPPTPASTPRSPRSPVSDRGRGPAEVSSSFAGSKRWLESFKPRPLKQRILFFAINLVIAVVFYFSWGFLRRPDCVLRDGAAVCWGVCTSLLTALAASKSHAFINNHTQNIMVDIVMALVITFMLGLVASLIGYSDNPVCNDTTDAKVADIFWTLASISTGLVVLALVYWIASKLVTHAMEQDLREANRQMSEYRSRLEVEQAQRRQLERELANYREHSSVPPYHQSQQPYLPQTTGYRY
eukprot:NODE_2706_length_1138_cov_19.553719_g2484_i0.p1 GENE.NODE_2706_length_1138_cov_19.553719_g2484_i0~~NODE_2706_length_1138_cov_19.553719_g2484_i0.p1  ORF type:complete len:248 (-),score=40.40 NODE_2706_length_1138_cov_19.553719_g2484_i0:192-935(-)